MESLSTLLLRVIERRPLETILWLEAVLVVIALAVTAADGGPLPDVRWVFPSFYTHIVVAVIGLGLLVWLGPRWMGIVPHTEWRETRLLWPLGLVAILPFIGGLKGWLFAGLDGAGLASLLTFLLLLIVATAVGQELIFRGLVVSVLRQGGDMFAAAGSAVLTGIFLLAAESSFGGLALTTVVTMVPFAFGLAALRLRTNALLPLIVAHTVFSLGVVFGSAYDPVTATTYLGMILLGVYGYLLLREEGEDDRPSEEPHAHAQVAGSDAAGPTTTGRVGLRGRIVAVALVALVLIWIEDIPIVGDIFMQLLVALVVLARPLLKLIDPLLVGEDLIGFIGLVVLAYVLSHGLTGGWRRPRSGR